MWNLNKDGDRMKHILYEDDGGNKRTVTIPVKVSFKGVEISADIPITIGKKDDFIGESLVNYCQDIAPNGFEYKPSNHVTFEMKER